MMDYYNEQIAPINAALGQLLYPDDWEEAQNEWYEDLRQVSLFRPQSQKAKVLIALRAAGKKGVDNQALNAICFRYAARIKDLRDDGHHIKSVKLKGSHWIFILEDV